MGDSWKSYMRRRFTDVDVMLTEMGQYIEELDQEGFNVRVQAVDIYSPVAIQESVESDPYQDFLDFDV